MGCDSLYDSLYGVMLEYSIDMGQTWRPVIEECAPPKFECTGYHLSSEYMSDQHRNWTRVTTYLPAGAVYVLVYYSSHPLIRTPLLSGQISDVEILLNYPLKRGYTSFKALFHCRRDGLIRRRLL